MKKLNACIALTLLLCLLTACGSSTAPEAPESPASEPPQTTPVSAQDSLPSLAQDEAPVRTLCRIADGAEDGNLLLAALDGGCVYRLPAENLTVTLDGQPADPSVLEDGMPVEVAHNGLIQETFPAGFGEVYSIAAWSRGQGMNGAGTTYDLCGLYLQVLEDLWEKDAGLNQDITQIAVDLSNAPGELSEAEKAAVIWRFGEKHGLESFAADFDELKEQGAITADPLESTANNAASYQSDAAFYHWEDGCLFSITPNEDHEGELYTTPVLFFNAEKWRSSLGAYYLYDCQANWGQTSSWSYQVGSEMIS